MRSKASDTTQIAQNVTFQRKISCLRYKSIYVYAFTLCAVLRTMLYFYTFIGVHSSDVEVEAGQRHYLSDEHA